jgi:hypothetical protein
LLRDDAALAHHRRRLLGELVRQHVGDPHEARLPGARGEYLRDAVVMRIRAVDDRPREPSLELVAVE